MSRLLVVSLAAATLVTATVPAQGTADHKQEIEALEKEVESLRKQVADQRARAGGVIDVPALLARVRDRAAVYRTVQTAPVPAAGQPAPASQPVAEPARPVAPDTDLPPQGAKVGGRLLGDAEKARLPAGTIFSVDGSPVSKQEFDDLVAYLKSYARGKADVEVKQHAMVQLIRVHAVEAARGPRAAQLKQRMLDARKKVVEEKKEFEAVAKEMSDDPPAKENGGDVGFFQRDGMELPFAKAAFGHSMYSEAMIAKRNAFMTRVFTRGVLKG